MTGAKTARGETRRVHEARAMHDECNDMAEIQWYPASPARGRAPEIP